MGKLFTPQNLNSGFNSDASLTANFEAIEAAFDSCLSRTGEAPNAMESSLDMNGQSILNASNIATTGLVVGGEDFVGQIGDIDNSVSKAEDAKNDAETAKDLAESAYNNILYAEVVQKTSWFTLVEEDTNKVFLCDRPSEILITLSDQAKQGTQAVILQKGDGVVRFDVQGTDTLLSLGNLTKTSGKGAAVSVLKIPGGWYLGGSLA